jgi:hypothetical protein
MKVYVLYDDPIDYMTKIYGVFKDRKDAINQAEKLADGSDWDLIYDIVQVELK